MEHEVNHKRFSHLLKEIMTTTTVGSMQDQAAMGEVFFFFFLKVYKALVGFTMDIKEARRARDYTKT